MAAARAGLELTGERLSGFDETKRDGRFARVGKCVQPLHVEALHRRRSRHVAEGAPGGAKLPEGNRKRTKLPAADGREQRPGQPFASGACLVEQLTGVFHVTANTGESRFADERKSLPYDVSAVRGELAQIVEVPLSSLPPSGTQLDASEPDQHPRAVPFPSLAKDGVELRFQEIARVREDALAQVCLSRQDPRRPKPRGRSVRLPQLERPLEQGPLRMTESGRGARPGSREGDGEKSGVADFLCQGNGAARRRRCRRRRRGEAVSSVPGALAHARADRRARVEERPPASARWARRPAQPRYEARAHAHASVRRSRSRAGGRETRPHRRSARHPQSTPRG